MRSGCDNQIFISYYWEESFRQIYENILKNVFVKKQKSHVMSQDSWGNIIGLFRHVWCLNLFLHFARCTCNFIFRHKWWINNSNLYVINVFENYPSWKMATLKSEELAHPLNPKKTFNCLILRDLARKFICVLTLVW